MDKETIKMIEFIEEQIELSNRGKDHESLNSLYYDFYLHISDKMRNY